jgi:hypothetical protein
MFIKTVFIPLISWTGDGLWHWVAHLVIKIFQRRQSTKVSPLAVESRMTARMNKLAGVRFFFVVNDGPKIYLTSAFVLRPTQSTCNAAPIWHQWVGCPPVRKTVSDVLQGTYSSPEHIETSQNQGLILVAIPTSSPMYNIYIYNYVYIYIYLWNDIIIKYYILITHTLHIQV